jgi:hypothetical protein
MQRKNEVLVLLTDKRHMNYKHYDSTYLTSSACWRLNFREENPLQQMLQA